MAVLAVIFSGLLSKVGGLCKNGKYGIMRYKLVRLAAANSKAQEASSYFGGVAGYSVYNTLSRYKLIAKPAMPRR
jgi:hypothetical protein